MMINIKGVEGQEVNVAPKPKFISEELREASWEGRQWLRLEREKKKKKRLNWRWVCNSGLIYTSSTKGGPQSTSWWLVLRYNPWSHGCKTEGADCLVDSQHPNKAKGLYNYKNTGFLNMIGSLNHEWIPWGNPIMNTGIYVLRAMLNPHMSYSGKKWCIFFEHRPSLELHLTRSPWHLECILDPVVFLCF